jgi:DNA mismatch repair ATPase MutL
MDRKFWMFRRKGRAGLLVVVDVHAADERIRLEELEDARIRQRVQECGSEVERRRLTSLGRLALSEEERTSLAAHACRSAIRFGDEVPADGAVALAMTLARCKRPFVCAHGRPTAIPLLTVVFDQSTVVGRGTVGKE